MTAPRDDGIHTRRETLQSSKVSIEWKKAEPNKKKVGRWREIMDVNEQYGMYPTCSSLRTVILHWRCYNQNPLYHHHHHHHRTRPLHSATLTRAGRQWNGYCYLTEPPDEKKSELEMTKKGYRNRRSMRMSRMTMKSAVSDPWWLRSWFETMDDISMVNGMNKICLFAWLLINIHSWVSFSVLNQSKDSVVSVVNCIVGGGIGKSVWTSWVNAIISPFPARRFPVPNWVCRDDGASDCFGLNWIGLIDCWFHVTLLTRPPLPSKPITPYDMVCLKSGLLHLFVWCTIICVLCISSLWWCIGVSVDVGRLDSLPKLCRPEGEENSKQETRTTRKESQLSYHRMKILLIRVLYVWSCFLSPLWCSWASNLVESCKSHTVLKLVHLEVFFQEFGWK